MKALLVAPTVVRHTEHWPPYGVLSLWWRVKTQFSVDFLDGTHLSVEQIAERCRGQYDVVGISSLFAATMHHVLQLIRLLKTAHNPPLVICGGAQATFEPEQYMRAGADFVVLHEGEEALAELLHYVNEGAPQSLPSLRGIAFLQHDAMVATPPRPLLRDLDELPFPDLSGLDLSQYHFPSGGRIFPFETSRGCCNACRFCYTHNMWQRWRWKSPERVLAEFRYYCGQDIQHLEMCDDNCGVSVRRLKTIAGLIAAEDRKIPWTAALCQEPFVEHPELAECLHAAGCETIQSAVDSAEQRILDYYRKPSSREKMRCCFNAAKKAGLVVNTQVIVGAPIETIPELWRSMNFGRRYADVFTISTLEPRPGCDFWNEAVRSSYMDFGKGVSLLHARPHIVEILVIIQYLLFYLHPATLFKALFGKRPVRRQLSWHIVMYAATMMRKCKELIFPGTLADT